MNDSPESYASIATSVALLMSERVEKYGLFSSRENFLEWSAYELGCTVDTVKVALIYVGVWKRKLSNTSGDPEFIETQCELAKFTLDRLGLGGDHYE